MAQCRTTGRRAAVLNSIESRIRRPKGVKHLCGPKYHCIIPRYKIDTTREPQESSIATSTGSFYLIFITIMVPRYDTTIWLSYMSMMSFEPYLSVCATFVLRSSELYLSTQDLPANTWGGRSSLFVCELIQSITAVSSCSSRRPSFSSWFPPSRCHC